MNRFGSLPRAQKHAADAEASESPPFVNLVFALLLSMDIAKAFGQSAAWGVILLAMVSSSVGGRGRDDHR